MCVFGRCSPLALDGPTSRVCLTALNERASLPDRGDHRIYGRIRGLSHFKRDHLAARKHQVKIMLAVALLRTKAHGGARD